MYFGNNINGLEAKFNTPENQSSKVNLLWKYLLKISMIKNPGMRFF